MITTVLLDAGGTLVMPNFVRIAAEFARDGVAVSPESLARAEIEMRLAYERTSYSRGHADPWISYMQELARLARVSHFPVEAFERLRQYHDTENLWEDIIEGSEAALTSLGRRFRLGIISNANGTVRKAFARLGLGHFFETIVDSAEEGCEKPDPRIFRVALSRMQLDPSEVVYVGDIFRVDVIGARGVGMRGILLDIHGYHADKPCERVRALADLEGLLIVQPQG